MEMIRVVIADDHQVARRGMRDLLDAQPDITVIGEAADGRSALQLAKQRSPDVLVLDNRMPDLTGVEVLQRLSDADVVIPSVILSATSDSASVRYALAAGAAGYLTKDADMDVIVAAVRGVARGEGGWLSRQAAAQARSEPAAFKQLTPREREVLRLVTRGWTNAQMADELGISERTVRHHLSNIYDKLEVRSRNALLVWAIDHGVG